MGDTTWLCLSVTTCLAGCTATALLGGPDVVLVQDTSGSFSSEIESAKAGDLALVDCVRGQQGRFGYVTFTGVARSELPGGVVRLDEGTEEVDGAIRATATCSNPGALPCGGTNIAAGLFEALRLLEDSPWGSIVLVSDGAPTAKRSNCKTVDGAYLDAFGAAYCPGWNDEPTDELLVEAAVDLAQAANDARHSVSVVFFAEKEDEAQTALLKSLVVGRGIDVETTDADELSGLLVSVCESL